MGHTHPQSGNTAFEAKKTRAGYGLDKEGMRAMCDALKTSTTLTWLDLVGEQQGPAHRTIKQDQNYHQTDSTVQDGELCKALQNNTALTHLEDRLDP